MRIKKAFELDDLRSARAIVRAHPFATLVSAELRATHMPCLLDEDADELTLLGHVARADPFADVLDESLLAIFAGPHGYVSASWYDRESRTDDGLHAASGGSRVANEVRCLTRSRTGARARYSTEAAQPGCWRRREPSAVQRSRL